LVILLFQVDMPRTYVRKTNKGSWSEDNLKQALDFVKAGNSIRAASKHFNIPFETLRKRKCTENVGKPKLGRCTVLSTEDEKLLTARLQLLDNLFYGLAPSEIRRIAYEYAESKNLPHNFSKVTKLAGRDWFQGFIKRNPLRVRKPEAVSINRITGLNRDDVMRFFKNLEDVMTKEKYTPDNIYNMDETGVTTVQDPGKVVSTQGKKRVGSVTSWERGKNITVICSMNAAGNFIPPMFIFPRKRMSPQLQKDGPPCAIYDCTHNGWSNETMFVKWLKHFIHHSNASAERKVLLLLDNHTSHVTLESLELCRQNGITMLSIPPHTSHRMQPLDVSFYSPLKSGFRRECDLYMRSANLLKITPYEIAGLFNKAYCKTATMTNAVAGFKDTGIHPLNPNVFTDIDFLPADTLLSNLEVSEIVVENDEVMESPICSRQNAPDAGKAPNGSLDNDQTLCRPSTSRQGNDALRQDLTLENLIPLPKKMPVGTRKKGQKKQHSEVLTSTPQKNLILERMKIKEEKEREKELKRKRRIENAKKKDLTHKDKKTKNNTNKGKKARRNLDFFTDSEEEEENVDDNLLCDDDEFDDLSGEEEETCFICEDYGKDKEEWYRCTSCGVWVHALCSGFDTPNDYICDKCR
jgi:hypothetical protein